ncbi:hypothetical protein [Stenotrophomonas sp. MMGLT7]|uniref:hypothetical protein n=1 Tax=Stenotrophomonas sp. MMGLT7 TaxID=2901227 RepID=UPI001E420384|nr:hypothetical protein [Stenotrophomonas sp. MMGLT7]MCD7098910.1 hypothetical protein [Stenotrophomonas sp. MMGLT7]
MRRGTIAVLLLAQAIGPAFAAAPREAARIPTTSRTVAMLADVAPPCVSIGLQEAVTASIPRSRFDRYVAARPPHRQSWSDERERLAWIAGDRAALLLRATERAPRDALGCNVVTFEQVPNDSRYLLASLIEAGEAAVSVTDRPGFAPAVTVVDVDSHCRNGPLGGKHYWLEDTRFLRLVTCVT